MITLTALRSTLCCALSLSLTLGSTVALAAPAADAAPAPAEGEPPPDGSTDTGVSAEEKSRGEELSEQAIEAFNAKDYTTAVDLFKQAYDADPQPNYLFNIGRVYEEAGDLEHAVEFYSNFVKQPGVALDSREVAVDRLKVLKAILAETEKPEEKPEEKPVEVEEKPVEPPPPAVDTEGERKSKTLRGAGFALAGIGVAALIGGGVAGGLAQSDNNDAANAESIDDRRTLLDSSKNKAVAADVLFGVGGALLVTGVVLVVVGFKKKPANGSKVAFAPSFGPRAVGADLRFRF
ncbi:MAG: hypothetical protein KC457_04180 [Myxococcales bacterium]|nr:hypothetical protein [Myxococcales bacterium]